MFKTNCMPLKFIAGLAGTIAAIAPIAHMPATAQSPPSLDNVTIGSRFSPNPLEVRGKGGGSTPAHDLVGRSDSPTGSCTGFASTKPDLTLVLTSFFNSLSIQVQSAEDTALVIQGPGGVWCNDDFQGKNPGVSGQWLAGTYKVWVASYGKNRSPNYTLQITEKR